nr:hypothetical protein [uncultured Mediterranean phage uvMED]
MEISNIFGGLSDKLSDLGKMFGLDDDKKQEFQGGGDRNKNKALERRLSIDNSYYRKSMPAPVEGSAPGISSSTNKTTLAGGAIPDTGQGVNFFGYGNTTNVNRFSEQDSQFVSTNVSSTGNVKISGFTTYKKPQSESDYGKGDPASAADASFYRNKLFTGKYGEMYKTASGGASELLSATGGLAKPLSVQIAFGSDADKIQDGVVVPDKAKPKYPIRGGRKPMSSGAPSDPLAQVKRNLPNANDTKDGSFLSKFNTEFASELYQPIGDLPYGTKLPHFFDSTGEGKWVTYSDRLKDLNVGIGQASSAKFYDDANNTQGGGIQDTKPGQSPDTQASNPSTFSQISDNPYASDDPSPLLSDPLSYKKTFQKRRLTPGVHVSPKISLDDPDGTTKRRIARTSRTDDFERQDGDSVRFSPLNPVIKEGQSVDSEIDKRIANSYHKSDGLLPNANEMPNEKSAGAPVNTTIFNLKGKLSDDGGDNNKKQFGDGGANAEAARLRTSTDKFRENYGTSLQNLGIDNQTKDNSDSYFNDVKSIDLLNMLGQASTSTAGNRSIGSDPNLGKDGSQTTGPNSSLKTYEQRLVGNPYYLYNKKVPNYSKQGQQKVTQKDDDNLRIDNFNKKSVLDASDASLDEHPDWAKEDFVPLYFHDLVNKKYIPFRSFINSLSDQSDAKYTATQYLGRADEVQIYNGFTRTMSIDFNVVAFSVDELHPMWQRINYMVGLTKPAKYTDAGFIVPPLVKFNLGDIYRNQPVIITSVSTTIPQEATWELVNNEKVNGDSEKSEYDFANGQIKKSNVKVARYPTMCTLAVSMTTMEKTAPETIQNHFGTLKKNSTGSFEYDNFNKDLTTYQEKTNAENAVAG